MRYQKHFMTVTENVEISIGEDVSVSVAGIALYNLGVRLHHLSKY